MAKYKFQHTTPEAYLKYFSTDKFVHALELRNRYAKYIKKIGIGSKIFKKKKYYDFPNKSNEPILEKAFGKIESKLYEDIIFSIRNKNNIGLELKMKSTEWIFMIKTRSTFFRENFEELFTWTEKTKYGLVNGKSAMDARLKEFEADGKHNAKAFQLSLFLDPKMHANLKENYIHSFLIKQWEVLTSDCVNFITSDNPGFSISFSEDIIRLNLSPLSSAFNLDNSINTKHYFPLTNNSCLCLTPHIEIELEPDKEVDWSSLMSADVIYTEVSKKQIDFINKCTYLTSNDVVVAKEHSDLLDFEKNPPTNGISSFDTIQLFQ